jgi:hypothetical protein
MQAIGYTHRPGASDVILRHQKINRKPRYDIDVVSACYTRKASEADCSKILLAAIVMERMYENN